MTLEEKEAIASRLKQILGKGGGRLTAAAVIKDARKKSSPLHQHFEWDDSVAAEKYRVRQARELIRSVKINEIVDHRTVSVVAYVHDPSDQHKQGYVETVSLISDKERATETLLREFNRIKGTMRRCQDIAAVLGLETELDQLLASINVIIERTESEAA